MTIAGRVFRISVPSPGPPRPRRPRLAEAGASPGPILGFRGRPVGGKLLSPAFSPGRAVGAVESPAVRKESGPDGGLDERADPLGRQLLFQALVEILVHRDIQADGHSAPPRSCIIYIIVISAPRRGRGQRS